MSDTTIQQNPLGLSDEDFLNQPIPGSEIIVEEAEPAAEPNNEQQAAVEAEPVVEQIEAVASTAPEQEAESHISGEPPVQTSEAELENQAAPVLDAQGNPVVEPEANKVVEPVPSLVPAEGEAVDYKAFYDKVLAPFTANGKTIQLKSHEEAVQLMQMGANYTRKLQDIAPYRKHLLMLEKSNLLNEGKLSFLIDLERKDPAAIKKLLQDADIDPMDLDTATPSEYVEGNHTVSDEEANFKTALDDITSKPEGQGTVRLIHDTWDQTSKDVLWSQPELLNVIHDQRANGVYDQITTEMERLKILGQIPANTPFIQAYHQVGNTIFRSDAVNQGQPNTAVTQAPAPVVEPAKPVAVTITAPKNQAINGDKAKAAGAVRSEPRKAAPLVNPLAMSDEEFLRNFENRL